MQSLQTSTQAGGLRAHQPSSRRRACTVDRVAGRQGLCLLQLPGVAVSRCNNLVARTAPAPQARVAATQVHQSVDPLVALNDDGIYRPGKTFIVHQPEAEMPQFINSSKLTILMCKSSHCKPCKRFASTYHRLAERFADCQLLEITGDESPDTRKYMKMALKVKVTPSFYFWRNGTQIHTMTGTASGQLRNAILERLQPDEAGRDWTPPPGSSDDPCED